MVDAAIETGPKGSGGEAQLESVHVGIGVDGLGGVILHPRRISQRLGDGTFKFGTWVDGPEGSDDPRRHAESESHGRHILLDKTTGTNHGAITNSYAAPVGKEKKNDVSVKI